MVLSNSRDLPKCPKVAVDVRDMHNSFYICHGLLSPYLILDTVACHSVNASSRLATRSLSAPLGFLHPAWGLNHQAL